MTSTRHHLAHLLKYYPRPPCAPSLIKSRFFRSTTIYLLTYIFTFLKFLICIHAGTSRVPPRVLVSGPKPCGSIKKECIKKFKFVLLTCLLPFLATKGSRVLEEKVNETEVSKTVFSHLKSFFFYRLQICNSIQLLL